MRRVRRHLAPASQRGSVPMSPFVFSPPLCPLCVCALASRQRRHCWGRGASRRSSAGTERQCDNTRRRLGILVRARGGRTPCHSQVRVPSRDGVFQREGRPCRTSSTDDHTSYLAHVPHVCDDSRPLALSVIVMTYFFHSILYLNFHSAIITLSGHPGSTAGRNQRPLDPHCTHWRSHGAA